MRHSASRAMVPAMLLAGIVLLLAAAMIAPAAPSARALTNCDVGDYALDGVESDFLALINDYRAQNGLGTLTVSTNLNRAAHWMGNDLGTNAYFSHTDSLGRSPYQRAIECGYPAGAGENLAAGTAWTTAQSAFDAWEASPGHNANMLNTYYRQIGIARVQVTGSPYTWYWVTNFGSADDGTGGGGSTPTNTPAQPATATPTNAPTSTPTPAPAQATATPEPTQQTPATVTPTPTSTPAQAGGSAGAPSPQPTATSTPTPAPSSTPQTTATPAPTTPATPPSGSLALRPGINFVGWTGAAGDPRDALKSIEANLRVVYGFDAATGKWLRYGPGLPEYVNTLARLETGEAYWLFTK